MSEIGCSIDKIETPALLIDLNVLERNIGRMSEYFSKVKSSLRPHAKTHKSPIIAHKQVKAGAIGVCCQKLGEAEVMLSAGIENIMITNQIVDPSKIKRLISISKHGRVIVAVDNLKVARATSEAALKAGIRQDVVIEVDVGLNRCGVDPGKPTLKFAEKLAEFKGLNITGLLGYEGPFFKIHDFEERRRAANQRNRLLIETRDLLEDAGFNIEIVSAGSTGTYNITGSYPGITEVEAGSYVFMDVTYKRLKNLPFELSLTLLSTVISRPKPDRAVIDAGLKSITQEFGLPVVKGIEGITLQKLSEEHGILKIEDPNVDLDIGDRIELIPTHCCTTVNLHDKYYCVRDGVLEAIWDIPARGKIR